MQFVGAPSRWENGRSVGFGFWLQGVVTRSLRSSAAITLYPFVRKQSIQIGSGAEEGPRKVHPPPGISIRHEGLGCSAPPYGEWYPACNDTPPKEMVMKIRKHMSRGFTLIELLCVIAVIAVLIYP